MIRGRDLAVVSCLATGLACGPLVGTPGDDSNGDDGNGEPTSASSASSASSDSTDTAPPPGVPPSATSGPSEPGDPSLPTGTPPDPGDPAGTDGPGPIGPGSTGSTGFLGTSSSDTGLPPDGKTTAGSGGGQPGGVGPDAVPDDEDDVTLPGADVLAAAVYTDGTLVDFRVQFAAAPFGNQTTYNLTWCLETGQPGGTSCAMQGTGIDAYLSFIQDGPSGQFVSGTEGVDPCLHTAFEGETTTFRVLVPVDVFPGTDEFTWILGVAFGGSFGVNEWVPDQGFLDVVFVDELPPFSGEPSC